MRCPFCSFEDTKVIDSRPADNKKRRRRECTNCGKRFTTYEVVEMPLLSVQKRDGTFELFDKEKLTRGICSAVTKRPVTIEQVNEIVEHIEVICANEMRNQITSTEIGDIVLEHLKNLDDVAYIRFASVYKDFSDVDSFIGSISELKNK